MILGVYSIRDDVQGGCLGLKTFANDATAKRDFANIIKVNHSDFHLIKCGEYDTVNGVITAAPMPIVLMDGLELITDKAGN